MFGPIGPGNRGLVPFTRFRRGSGGFTPADLTGLALWLKGDAGTYQSAGGSAAVSDGDPVGQWQDQSGNGRHCSQENSTAYRPTLRTGVNGLNGLPVLRGDGVDDMFDTMAVSGLAMSEYSLFVVTKSVSTINNGGWAGSAAGATALIVDEARYIISDGTTSTGNQSHPDPTSWTVLEAHVDATGWSMVDAGAQFASGVQTFSATLTRIMGSGSRSYNGYVAELIWYSDRLSSGDQALVRAYLNSRWGL